MRVGILFLMAYSLFGETVLLQTGDVRKPPSLNDARMLLSSLCPSSQITNHDRAGMLACKACPKWTGDSTLNGYAVIAIHFGHFTAVDADQALVATEGCEPHSENWGGSVLFALRDGKWRFSRYLEGVITDNCSELEATDGRTVLMCSREEAHQSVLTRLLYTIDLRRQNISYEKTALVLTDTMPNCGFNYADAGDNTTQPLQKAVFRKISIDRARGEVSAEVEFGIRRITATEAGECQHRAVPPSIAPHAQLYKIQFHFDGQRLAPSPESVAAMRIVQDQRSVLYPAMEPVSPPSSPTKQRPAAGRHPAK